MSREICQKAYDDILMIITERMRCAGYTEGGMTHAKEIVEDRWSVREITSGILWASSALEMAAGAWIVTECILIC